MLKTIEVPPITIEAGVQVTAQQVADLYIQASEALGAFFGQPLLEGSVSKIYLSRHVSSKGGDLGRFTPDKSLRIYPNRIKQEAVLTLEDVTNHELGHAYHAQVYAAAPIRNIPYVGREAVAEMMVPIIAENGEADRIANSFAKLMNCNNRLLFGPITMLSRYPNYGLVKTDSAQLFYVVNRYGFSAALNLVAKTTLGLAGLNNVKTDFLRLNPYQVGARLLEMAFINRLGVTRAQLFHDAREWYLHKQ